MTLDEANKAFDIIVKNYLGKTINNKALNSLAVIDKVRVVQIIKDQDSEVNEYDVYTSIYLKTTHQLIVLNYTEFKQNITL